MGKLKKSSVFLTFLVAALLAPAAAIGAAIVPPGNSAVNQYTQTIPTSQGNQEVRHKGHRSPSQTLGHKATKNLQKQGKDGQATAELASAGTPSDTGSQAGAAGSGKGPSGGNGPGGSGGSASGGGASGGSGGQAQSGVGDAAKVAAADKGKSGVGQVLGEVTGTSSSGDLGLLLPLAIIAACVWCGAYFWRHRRTAA